MENGATLLVLSDRGVNEEYAAIPALLAGSALHQYMVKKEPARKQALLLNAEKREKCTILRL